MSPGDILSPRNWNVPLAQFAQATGLAVTLFNEQLQPVSGPHLPSPLTQAMDRSGAWSCGGYAHRMDSEAAREALDSHQPLRRRALDQLMLYALPVHQGTTRGVLVAGWCLDCFPDELTSDRLCRQFAIPYVEMWQVLRRQPPVGAEKFTVYTELLQTLVGALLRQLNSGRADRHTARQLALLNHAAHKLTGAVHPREIAHTSVRTLRQLTRAGGARLRLRDDGQWSTLVEEGHYAEDPAAPILHGNTIRVPVPGPDGQLMGVLEACREETFPAIEQLPELGALAAQTGVALQRAEVIADLERERETLKKTLAELERLNRLKDEFLSMVSHELRSPLQAILGWLQVLQLADPDEAQYNRAMSAIERNARDLARLVDQLLDSARILSGKLSLDIQDMDLVAVVDQALETVGPTAREKGLRLERLSRGGPLPMRGDPHRLRQVFWNLLNNAIKFTPADGRVTISVAARDERVRVRVRDTGQGIPRALLGRIFERFTQNRDGGQGGLGLGLTIARSVVEHHGGTLRADSAGPGQGATFTVELPRQGPPGRVDGLDYPT